MSAIHQLLTEHLDIWTAADTGPKSGRGRSSANAASVYGIRKLRELILELAVRGKLVPQDAGDEPASELLKRIQAEKTKLVTEGKLKKDKPQAAIADDERPFDLPIGWSGVYLTEVLALITDGDHQPPPKADTGVPFLVIGNLNTGVVTFSGCRIVPREYYDGLDWGRKPKSGDILYTVTGSYGIPIPVNGNQEFCVQRHVAILKATISSPSKYITLMLGAKYAKDYAGKVATGIAQKTVPLTGLRKMYVPLPPLAEQHRIVAKVDELMALCDQLESGHNNATEAHEKLVSHLLGTLTQSQSAEDFGANWQRIAAHFDTLFTTEASIDALKQTLLQLAVMGKLVPQEPNDEPACELLKRIQAEKAKLVAEGNIKKDKPLLPITDEEEPFSLPNGWNWVRLNELLRKIGAGSTPLGGKQVYISQGIPFLRSQNVWDEGLRLDDVAFISAETHQKMSGTHVFAGDLLFNITGASIGRCAIVPEDFVTGNVSQHVTIVRPVSNFILQFLHLVMISRHVQQTVMDVQVGVSREGLSIGKLGQFIIPIPPLAEQHRIVAKVDELMILCDQLKSRLTEASQLQQKLADVLVENAVIAKDLPEAPEQAKGECEQAIARTLLAAEVVHQLNAETRMGRVKLQKVVNLAEYIANLREVASEPMRNAAGPHDRHFMDQVLQGMKDRLWYEEQPVDGGKSYRYRPLAQAGQHRADYEALWTPEQRRKISDLIELMRSWKTDQCERVATLYAAWNDLLIEGQEASEAAILNEVMNRWNDSKLNYTEAQWQTELAAMKMHALLIPTGFGSRTTGGTQTLLLH